MSTYLTATERHLTYGITLRVICLTAE